MKDIQPFVRKHETYEQKKEKLDNEMNKKAAQTHDYMEKIREEKKKRKEEI
jgi:hypothetical protein